MDGNEKTIVMEILRSIARQYKGISLQTESEVQTITVILLYSDFIFHSFPPIAQTIWNQRWYFNT